MGHNHDKLLKLSKDEGRERKKRKREMKQRRNTVYHLPERVIDILIDIDSLSRTGTLNIRLEVDRNSVGMRFWKVIFCAR